MAQICKIIKTLIQICHSFYKHEKITKIKKIKLKENKPKDVDITKRMYAYSYQHLLNFLK